MRIKNYILVRHHTKFVDNYSNITYVSLMSLKGQNGVSERPNVVSYDTKSSDNGKNQSINVSKEANAGYETKTTLYRLCNCLRMKINKH